MAHRATQRRPMFSSPSSLHVDSFACSLSSSPFSLSSMNNLLVSSRFKYSREASPSRIANHARPSMSAPPSDPHSHLTYRLSLRHSVNQPHPICVLLASDQGAPFKIARRSSLFAELVIRFLILRRDARRERFVAYRVGEGWVVCDASREGGGGECVAKGKGREWERGARAGHWW